VDKKKIPSRIRITKHKGMGLKPCNFRSIIKIPITFFKEKYLLLLFYAFLARFFFYENNSCFDYIIQTLFRNFHII